MALVWNEAFKRTRRLLMDFTDVFRNIRVEPDFFPYVALPKVL